MPCPSESRLRLTPDLPRSVGWGPVFSPPSGAFVIAPSLARGSHSLPQRSSNRFTPACQRVKNTPASPQAWKRLCAVAWAHHSLWSNACHWQPVRKHVKDRIGTTPRWHTRSPAPKAMRSDVDGHQRLQDRPQRIGNAESGRGAIIGRTCAAAFLRFCFVHTLQYSRLFG